MIPTNYECPSGYRPENTLAIYLMNECHAQSPLIHFSCVDHSPTSVIRSNYNHNDLLFYIVEGVCGSLPCPPYNQDEKFSFGVCAQSKLLTLYHH